MNFMDEKKAKFLPFHAINEFMTEAFRLEVIHLVLSNLDKIPQDSRRVITDFIRREVRVNGFRNAIMAPHGFQAKASITVFEKRPDFVAAIIQSWCSLKSDLAGNVHALLTERGWTLLPVDANRTRLPGFLTRWAKSEEFEILDEAYRKAHPDFEGSDDDINLAVVWLSGRLPVDMVDITVEPLEQPDEA